MGGEDCQQMEGEIVKEEMLHGFLGGACDGIADGKYDCLSILIFI